MQKERKQRLQDEIIRSIRRLDIFSLQRLSAFIADLERGKAQIKEREGKNHAG